MTPLASLWLPILVAAQGRVLDALRSFNIKPVDYVVPHPTGARTPSSPSSPRVARW